MRHHVTGEVIEWRGPAPHLFVACPPEVADAIRAVASRVSYGWGAIPATVSLGATRFTTSLFPRHGTYLVPLKVAARRAERVDVGDVVDLDLEIDDRPGD